MGLAFGPNTATTASTPAYRFRRGYSEFTTCNTRASTLVNPGDLMVLDSAGPYACPIHQVTWDTTLATTQSEARTVFLGVAMDMKLASDASTSPIVICTRGIFDYPCAALSGAQNIGAFVNAAGDGTHNLRDQLLAIVATFDLSIGTLAENAANGATLLVVYMQSYLQYTLLGKSV